MTDAEKFKHISEYVRRRYMQEKKFYLKLLTNSTKLKKPTDNCNYQSASGKESLRLSASIIPQEVNNDRN